MIKNYLRQGPPEIGITGGPWQVQGCRHKGDLKIGPDTRLHMVGPDGDAVCAVFFDMKTGRGLADAHMISAAPHLLKTTELLEALCLKIIQAQGLNGAFSRDAVLALRASREALGKAKRSYRPI